MGRAQACEYLGQAYVALAVSPKALPSESRQYMTAAREQFQHALNIVDDSRRQASLGVNEKWAREIADELAKCDAALAK